MKLIACIPSHFSQNTRSDKRYHSGAPAWGWQQLRLQLVYGENGWQSTPQSAFLWTGKFIDVTGKGQLLIGEIEWNWCFDMLWYQSYRASPSSTNLNHLIHLNPDRLVVSFWGGQSFRLQLTRLKLSIVLRQDVKPKLILGANFISGRRNSVPTGIHDKRPKARRSGKGHLNGAQFDSKPYFLISVVLTRLDCSAGPERKNLSFILVACYGPHGVESQIQTRGAAESKRSTWRRWSTVFGLRLVIWIWNALDIFWSCWHRPH